MCDLAYDDPIIESNVELLDVDFGVEGDNPAVGCLDAPGGLELHIQSITG